MGEVKYRQGMTKAWSDGEKVVITNPSGNRHVETNVDQIFGIGEFKKLQEVAYSEEVDRTSKHGGNAYATPYELITGYIPKRVKLDIEKQSLPGTNEETLTDKYFSGDKK